MHRPTASPALALALSLATLALGLAGCGRTKAAQCTRLISAANAQEERLRPQMNAAGQSGDAAQIDLLATAFERSAREIAAVQLTDPQLQGMSRQYQGVITRFVTVSRSMAAAARAQDADGIQRAIPQLTTIENDSNAVIDRINRYCGAQ